MAKTTKTTSSFLDDFNKESSKMEGIALSSPAPKFWIDSGNFIINKVLSGSYSKGYAQGRMTMIAGPSGSGKTFLLANSIKSALEQGMGVLAIDSENALDDDYMIAIGADVIDNPNYLYRGVTTISQVVTLVSKFTQLYRKSENPQKFLIVIDSLDMLQTDSENNQYVDGEIRGDMGQHVRQLKQMLKRFVNDFKEIDVTCLCSKHVYKEQDARMAMQTPYVITESLKFAFSQILLISKLMLKDDKTKVFEGITLKVRGEKTRFTKPFQQCRIEVPYDTGMDPYTGVLDAAETLGIVKRSAAWYTYNSEKFQSNKFSEYQEAILQDLITLEDKVLVTDITEEEDNSGVLTAKEIEVKRKTKGAVVEE